METEKLYYENPFLRHFAATVLSCEPAKAGYRVVLDRTAFYPEGGGQGADHGTLEGVAVTDVHETGGVVFHTCEKPLEPGAVVAGELDWARRFDHMQQHSGEHILSGILCADYHCDNVGFHLGADTVTIDYDAEISWEQALAAERKANQTVWADTPAQIFFPTPEELAALRYRSKKELTGAVRIVAFPGADCCACCGTHVRSAGQVGIIKILSCQKFRSGTRLELVCGARAWRYLSAVYDQAHAAGRHLSVKPVELEGAVERISAELAAARQRAAALETELFFHKAEALRGKGNVLLLQPPMGGDGARRLADAVAGTCGGAAAVFAGEDGRWNYALIDPAGGDLSPLVKALNAALKGRGGGRAGFAQGSVQACRAEIETFFNTREDSVWTMC